MTLTPCNDRPAVPAPGYEWSSTTSVASPCRGGFFKPAAGAAKWVHNTRLSYIYSRVSHSCMFIQGFPAPTASSSSFLLIIWHVPSYKPGPPYKPVRPYTSSQRQHSHAAQVHVMCLHLGWPRLPAGSRIAQLPKLPHRLHHQYCAYRLQ